MKRLILSVLFSSMALISTLATSFSLYQLSCEMEENPLGIENTHPCFSWKTYAVDRNFVQSAYRILVADSPEKLSMDQGNIWDSGKVNASSSVLVPFEGKDLLSATTYYWKVCNWNDKGIQSAWSETAQFTMGLLRPKDWGKALWIAMEADKPEEKVTPGITWPNLTPFLNEKKPAKAKNPQFRKEFMVNKPLKQAIAFISGMGHFDMFLNGKKVGNNFMDPGWTDYNKSILYVTFDITEQLIQGANTLGVMLEGGFYNTPGQRYLKLYTKFGMPKMRLHLKLRYEDGTSEEIVSDKSWKVTESPIIFSSIYGGEDYDATREIKGWMLSGFNDQDWNKVITSDNAIPMISQHATPVHIHQQLPFTRTFKDASGQWIYDMGQNFAGIFHLKVKAKKGQTIRLHPGERLKGTFVTQERIGSPVVFSYTAKGTGQSEEWQPQFTYFGYRYIRIEGAVPAGEDNPDNLPVIENLTGLHITNSAPEAGTFSCSNPLFNKTHELIDWAMRSNMTSVLTDCPHREKLGWLEQYHLMQYSLQYRYQLSRLYEKCFNDMQQAQRADGMIPTIAPQYVIFEQGSGFEDTPEWGSAFIISPWYTYLWYGDKRPIQKYYSAMQKYLEYLGTRADNYIIDYGLSDWYDLGPEHPGYSQLTTRGVTATAFYFYDAKIMQQIALLLEKEEDAQKYAELASAIKSAFNKKYFNQDTKTYDRNSQAVNAIALYFGLTEEENHAQVFQNLVADIRAHNNGLTAGDVGYRYVLRTLEANNAQQVIYDMNCKYDVPGYGYQLAHDATALTEGWRTEGSNNHFMLGHLMEWLYSGLGGIRQQEGSVAFKKILIDPQIVGDITHARTSYESPYGLIRSEWKLDAQQYTLKVEIPANSEAIICLPTAELDKVTEHGQPVKTHKEISNLDVNNGRLRVKVGSGSYLFQVK